MSQIDDAINSLSSEELDLLNSDPKMLADFKAKYSQPKAEPTWLDALQSQTSKRGLFGTSIGEGSDWLQKVRMGAQAVREGGKAMGEAGENQSQNVFLNAAQRVPGTIADIGSELVAGAVEPESLALQGAVKAAPLVNKFGRWVGKAAEGISGIEGESPGALAKAVEKPSRFFGIGRGSEQAGKMYEGLVDRSQVRPSMKGPENFMDRVREGQRVLAEGDMTPDEALVARRALDKVRRKLLPDDFIEIRDKFDEIAKTKFAGADVAFKEGLISDALREPLPITQSGRPSRWLTGLGMLGLGTAYKTGSIAPALLGLTASPAVQGATAAGIGLAKRAAQPILQAPTATGIGLSEYLRRDKKK